MEAAAGHLDGAQGSIALDAKPVRGSLHEDGRAGHLSFAILYGAGIVIDKEEVDPKSNDITALLSLLESIDITSAVVTADAMHR